MQVAPRWLQAGLCAAAAALFSTWAFVTPIFEAPDEPAHWQFARHLHDEWQLPVYRAGFEEANSPPLYYLAVAPAAIASDLPPMVTGEDVRGQAVSLAPPRTFFNTDHDRDWYRPVLWARLITVLMSVVTVWICFRAGAAAAGDWRTGLIAASIVAGLPQFAFRSGTVSNDAMVTLWAAAVTWQGVRLVREGFTWRRGVLAAVALACAFLSKVSAIALAAPLALALLEAPGRGGSATPTATRRLMRLGAFIVALAIVAPWCVRNITLYGDPFAERAMRTAVSHLITDRSIFSSYFVRDFPKLLFASFVGLFGWATLRLPNIAYLAFGLFGVVAGAGLAWGVVRQTIDRRVVRVLALTVVAVFAIVVYINLSFTQPQGRYLFPALPAIGVLMALGLTALPLRAAVVVPIGMGLFNLGCLAFVVIPAYYPALAHDLNDGSRRLYPTAAIGMRAAGADLRFTVDGDDPRWILPVHVPANRFTALDVDIAGDIPGAPLVHGVVRFSTTATSMQASPALDFTWRADGQPHTVRVSLDSQPAWRDTVLLIGIDPVERDPTVLRGREVHLGAIHLRGSARTR